MPTEVQPVIVKLLRSLGSRKEVEQYLKQYSEIEAKKFAIIKVGGGIIQDDLDSLVSSLTFLQRVGLFPIVIHGAGPQLNAALNDAGISTEIVNGQRVTSPETLEIARKVFQKQNLNKLVESIILQAEILDLKTDFDTDAKGIVLESKIDIGRGPIANVIITAGTLNKGDYFVSGSKWGKVRAIINDRGAQIDHAVPATPIEILGINGAAKSGDDFIVLKSEKEAKSLCDGRIQQAKENKNPLSFVTQDSAFKDSSSEELNIIIKSDVHGSSEAIKNAIGQIKHEEVKPKIILSDIGMVTETDVTLAKASNAVLIAFNVKPSKEAKKLAENENIKISSYNIIYEVIDFIKNKMSGLLAPDVQEKITGSAQILEIFKVSGAGKVAGSKVVEGEINSNSNVRIIRDGAIIYTGKIGSIFREKNQVKEVNNGQECGITVKDYMDFQKNDTIEAFSVTSTERSI